MKIAYKCIPKGMTSHGHEWKVGVWYRYEGELKLCPSEEEARRGVGGFHASKLLPDAFSYVEPYYVCKVAYRGEVIDDGDKFVAREMKIISKYKWIKRDSVEFCVSLKERMCKLNPDDRIRFAFEAAEAYLKNPCKKTKDAVGDAAWAVRVAACAASAEDAEKIEQHKTILKIINKRKGDLN